MGTMRVHIKGIGPKYDRLREFFADINADADEHDADDNMKDERAEQSNGITLPQCARRNFRLNRGSK